MKPTLLVLKSGRDKSLRRRHPWVFSGAVERLYGEAQPGDIVRVQAADGTFLAWAGYNAASQIVGRVWSFDEAEIVDDEFVAARLRQSASRRADVLQRPTDAARLVFAESDGLPGLIVDRYADTAVVEITAASAERWRDTITAVLAELPGVTTVFERSDTDVRDKERLPRRTGLLAGIEPPNEIEISEGPHRFLVDVREGHKTGFYLDQRDARAALSQLVRAGDHVLNTFAYTGSFGVVAGAAGAERIVNVDSSGAALAVAQRNADLNGARTEQVEADVFAELRRLRRATDERFDVIVLDPPKLAPSSRPEALDRATRAYKDLALQAFGLLNEGGRLVTFSCSGAMSDDLFQKVTAGAALDAGVDATIVGRLHQASDHPVALAVPETSYLKGLICRV